MKIAQILKEEFHNRTARNPNYSIRAFSRDINIDQSVVSRLMNGKRKPSLKLAEKIAVALGLPTEDLIQAVQNGPLYQDLSLDKFIATSDSYHDTILELIDTDDFRGDVNWISRRIGVPVRDVKAAVKRLVSLGLLEIDSENNWKDLSKYNQIHPTDDNCVQLRQYQRQILENSVKALASLPIHARSHTSITFSASGENIPRLKALIAKFRKEALDLMTSTGGQKTDVFCVQVGFFPLTKTVEETQ